MNGHNWRRRVLFVTNMLAPYRLPLFSALARWYDVVVLYHDAPPPAFERAEELYARHGVTTARMATTELAILGRRLVVPRPGLGRALNAKRPDILVLCNASPTAVMSGVAARRGTRKPLLFGWSGSCEDQAVSWGRLYYKRHYNTCEAIFCYGERTVKWLREIGVNPPVVNIGNNTLHEEIVWPKGKRAPEQGSGSNGRVRVLVVGRLVERKNPLGAIDIIRRANIKESVELCLVGSGPLKEEVSRAAYRAGMRIVLKEHVPWDEMYEVYNHADILLHPSRQDWWPQCVNEAMLVGLPVIVTEQSGIDCWFLRNGVNGFRYDADDPEQGARLLRMMIERPEVRKRVGDEARRTATSFGAERVAAVMRHWFEGIAGKGERG